jgi:hypothetical protein
MRAVFDHRILCQQGRRALDITKIYSTRQAIRVDGRYGLGPGALMSAVLALIHSAKIPLVEVTCWHISKPVYSLC